MIFENSYRMWMSAVGCSGTCNGREGGEEQKDFYCENTNRTVGMKDVGVMIGEEGVGRKRGQFTIVKSYESNRILTPAFHWTWHPFFDVFWGV
jgi:hypothetical protein